MTKKEIQTMAKGIFERYPKVEKVFVTSDGQAFFEEAHAKNHAMNNRSGKELAVESFLRPAEKADKTIKLVIAEIKAAETIDEVSAIVDEEQVGESRKSILDFAEKRITELNK